MLIIAAIVVALLSIVALYLEIKKDGFKVLKTPRFWVGTAVVLGAFLTLYLSNREQNIQNATTDRGIGQVQQRSNEIREKQQTQIETQKVQLEKQEVQLSEAKTQAEASKKQLEASQKQLELLNAQRSLSNQLREAQKGELELVTRLNLNHTVSGIELSFPTPSNRWAEIVKILKNIKPSQPDLSYADFGMMAEKEGNHWKINFEPLASTAGNKHIRRISTEVIDYKGFESALAVAALGLRIEWGDGTGPWLEPTHGDYPSAIYLSREKIGLILRPPLVAFSLNDLRELKKAGKATITFYEKNYPDPYRQMPPFFQVESLDPALALDQTIQLNWIDRGRSTIYEQQMNRVMSGPHQLNFEFNYFKPPSVPSAHKRRR